MANNKPKEPTLIEKLNPDYTKAKSTLAKLNAPGGLKDTIEHYQLSINNLEGSLLLKKHNLDFAKSKNDKATVQRLEQEIKTVTQQKEDLEKKLGKAQKILNDAQQKVDSKMEELMQDPATKQKLDSILYKTYDRKRKAEQKNKKALEEKKASLEEIKQIIDSDPKASVYYSNYTKNKQRIDTLTNLIKNLSSKSSLTTKEAQKLADAQSHLPKVQKEFGNNQNALIGHFRKHYKEIKVDNSILAELSTIGLITKKIKACDKSISNYDKLMNGLTVSQPIKNFTNPDAQLPVATENKPSWLHPIKRIKYNINARKLRNQAELQNQQSRNEQRKSFKDEIKLSKYEWKSDIAQDYLKKREEELHKAAKATRGNGGSSR